MSPSNGYWRSSVLKKAMIAIMVITALVGATGCVDDSDVELSLAKVEPATCTGEEMRDFVESDGEQPLLCDLEPLSKPGDKDDMESMMGDDPQTDLRICTGLFQDSGETILCNMCCFRERCCWVCYRRGTDITRAGCVEMPI